MYVYEFIMYDVCMYESIYTEVCAHIYANLTLIPLPGLAAWQVRVARQLTLDSKYLSGPRPYSHRGDSRPR